MRRREFITFAGGLAAAWPLGAHTEQTAMPVVGFLYSSTIESFREFMAGFNVGLAETGYVEGHNVAFENRMADGQFERLPALADDLVRDRVVVIVTASNVPAALAAKAATQTVPIVFMMGSDPVENGLVAVRLLMLSASSPSDIERAFTTLVEQQAGALLVGPDTFFVGQRDQLVALAARYRVPTSYFRREFIEAGGLISYSASVVGASRQNGVYVGRILKGENPRDLPVVQPTQFELVVNSKTAKALGMTIPQTLLATADEVIE